MNFRMMRKIILGLIGVMVISACDKSLTTGVPISLPTNQSVNTQQPATSTLPPLPTVGFATAAVDGTPEATLSATLSSENFALPEIIDSGYLDDRSRPAALILSYFNAINFKDYLRAYSYYENFTDLGTLETFSSGYRDTKSVKVALGQISIGGAAGSTYFLVPAVLNAVTTSGAQQKFAACYQLRLPQPQNYANPPITPMHIEWGTAQEVDLAALDDDVLADACPPEYASTANLVEPSVESLSDLSANNYIDNRSTAIGVVSSYLNAINLREYVRAFAYWQTPKEEYETFAAGFSSTESVTAQFGTVIPNPGAGQVFYQLPVAIFSHLSDGSQKTFVGCYTLHMTQPHLQSNIPYQPLGISEASVDLVDNTVDIAGLLSTACP